MPDDSKSSPTKNLDDQIRNVHLILLLVAFVILATSLQPSKRINERSISDARAIYNLASSLSPDAGPVGDEVIKEAAQYVAQSGDDFQKGRELNLEIIWPTGKQIVHLYGATGAVYLADARYKQEDDIDQPGYSYVPFEVRSLADFIRFWNHNATGQVAIVPRIETKNIDRLFLEQGLQNLGARSVRFSDERAAPQNTYLLHAGREGSTLTFSTYPVQGEPAIGIKVPLTIIPTINIQALLRKYAKKEQEWIPGKFESSFPELNERAKNLTTLDLQDLVKELNDEANREQDRVELLGAKWDPEIITRWGLLIMVTCQFYLWLHLDAMDSSLASRAESIISPAGWIGFYKSRWANAFTVITFAVPPAVAIFWLIRQLGVAGRAWQIVVAVNAFICLLLAAASTSTLLRLRKRLSIFD